jgi:glyoxylase-like metal-dependent hydrolase (beta-lactamase superfamily II)
MDHRVSDEIWLEPTPGHTPGHVSVRLASRGDDAVITGDLMHHPVQIAEPTWQTSFDSDPNEAIKTRRDFCERYGDRPIAVLGTHFHDPTAGRIVSEEGGFRFVVNRTG